MQLFELLPDDEQAILLAPMVEMANLFPDETGLPVIIWFGEVGGQHGPRIKVSNVRGKFAAHDNFVMSVDKEPRIVTSKNVKLKKNEVDDIIDWIKLNYDDLMLMWKMYETGSGKPAEIILGLKKI